MAAKTRGVVVLQERLLSRFKGALVGAVVGDCIGAHFEFCLVPPDKLVKQVVAFCQGLPSLNVNATDSDSDTEEAANGKVPTGSKDGTTSPQGMDVPNVPPKVSRRPLHLYTDDTAMARSVWASLVKHNKADATDLAKRFVYEYNKEPERGYGASVGQVFKALKQEGYKDPFGPASRHFGGTGSYGNGGAMRIAPAALYGYNMDDTQLNSVVDTITKITHTHRDGINGARLQCAAVRAALRLPHTAPPDTPTTHTAPLTPPDTAAFLSTLHAYTAACEGTQEAPADGDGQEPPDVCSPPAKRRISEKDPEPADTPYCDKLKLIEHYLKSNTDPTRNKIEDTLGNDVSALKSVPAAIYSFLRAAQPITDVPFDGAFERTIIYAITLGGDTDTIAAMAGAMAGAYYGIESIPYLWRETCEGVKEAEDAATALHRTVVMAHTGTDSEQCVSGGDGHQSLTDTDSKTSSTTN